MAETVNYVAFLLLAFAAIGGGVAMLATRNIAHAAFWLLEVMLATAGIYLLLSAEFLALVQVLVYAGAVSVLVLFTSSSRSCSRSAGGRTQSGRSSLDGRSWSSWRSSAGQ